MSMEAVQERLKELEGTIRRRILTEMKIKEGAENMRRATNDKRSLAHVRTIVNEANSTLHNLNQELNDVRTYLLMTSDDGAAGPAAVKTPGNKGSKTKTRNLAVADRSRVSRAHKVTAVHFQEGDFFHG